MIWWGNIVRLYHDHTIWILGWIVIIVAGAVWEILGNSLKGGATFTDLVETVIPDWGIAAILAVVAIHFLRR